MEKNLRYTLYVILCASIISMILTFTGNSNLSSMRQDLENAKRSADSALNELKTARITIDSLHSDISLMQSYVTYIQKSVALNDAIRIAEEAKSKEKIAAAKAKVEMLKNDIRTDSLPPTDERPLKIKEQL